MGTWHGTCGLTQLPIKDEEDAVLFLLGKNDLFEKEEYFPLTLPLFGLYDDLGGIKDESDPSGAVWLHLRHLAENGEAFGKLEAESLSDFIRKVGRGRDSGVSFMLVHKDAYDAVMKDFLAREEEEGASADERLGGFFGAPSRKLGWLLGRHLETGDEALSRAMSDLTAFDSILSVSHRAWAPQTGAGGNDAEYLIPKLFGELAIRKEAEFRSLESAPGAKGVCALTHLPIREGGKAVLFFLAKNKFARKFEGGCGLSWNMNAFHLPMAFPLFGVYDGNGGIQGAKDPSGEVLSHFRFLASRDKLFLEEKMSSLDSLIRSVAEGDSPAVSIMLVHQEAYDIAMMDFLPRKNCGDESYSDYLARIGREWLAERKAEDEEREIAHADLPPEVRRLRLGSDDTNAFSRFYDKFPRKTKWLLERYAETESEILLRAMADLMAFDLIMESMRKTWTPWPAAESGEYAIPKLLGEFAIAREAKEKELFLEDTMVDFDDPDDVAMYECVTRSYPWI